MKFPSYVSLSNAEGSYAVANTPIYLMRRLQEDPNIKLLNQAMSPEEVFLAFKKAVEKKPKTLHDFVMPYVFLVALSLQTKYDFLRKSSAIPVSSEYKWLSYIRQVLIETYRPLSMQETNMPKIMDSMLSTRSQSPIQHRVFEIGGNKK